MNLLFLTSEAAPFAKTGGLADVLAALPRHLHRAGHDVRVFLPFYGSIDTRKLDLVPQPNLRDIDIQLGPHRYQVSIVAATAPGGELPCYLVYCPVLYHRASIYTTDPDEHLRFLVLSYAALAACQRMGFAPDVVHCNDWQTALVPLALRTAFAWDQLFARARTLLTIHNLNYQGTFGAHVVPDTGMGGSAHLFHQDQLRGGRLNFLLHGILYADGISTVSPTYAKEIQTEKYGAGLDPFLRARSSTVVGILNGVDYDEWSPERDRHIPHPFSADDLSGKERDKEALLAALGLPYVPGVPVVGIVSRLAGQKGFALLRDVMPDLLRRHGFQFAVLGSGEGRFEESFAQLQRAFPRQVCFFRGFSNQLAHMIEAGADMFLMPSIYEPCGLNQMYSLRYGTVPIVYRTGGLADTVRQWNPATGEGTGVLFDHHDEAGLRWAIQTALTLYRDRPTWLQIMRNGMAENFSWDAQTRLYEELYGRLQALPR
ncbi:MAG TPA: glycogen synthase [Kofleriaceae bacterium]|nr:glycogen synthase [Kofleriaceae bacterium]